MCGIWGYDLPDGAVTPEQRKMLAFALGANNDVRGGDSWGAVLVNGSLEIRRGLGETWKDKDFRSLDIPGAHALLGHTRRATCGAATVENSHPFEIGKYIGVHNGIITNHDELNRQHNRNFAVDSMHIFAHLSEKLDTKDLRGYGTIAYMVKPELAGIYLCRFFSGELAVRGIHHPTEKKKTFGVMWSSSKFHLQDACKVAGVDTFEFQEPDAERVYLASGGSLWRLDEKIAIGSSYAVTGYYGTSDHYHDAAWGNRSGKDESTSSSSSRTESLPLSTGGRSASSTVTTGAKGKRGRTKTRYETVAGRTDWTIVREGHVTAVIHKDFLHSDVSGHVESGDDKGQSSVSLPS